MIQDIIDQIQGHHRERVFMMDQRKRINLALGAYLRMRLGWRKDKQEAERKKIAAHALKLISIGDEIFKAETKASAKHAKALAKWVIKGNIGPRPELEPRPLVKGEDDPAYVAANVIIQTTILGRSAFDNPEAAATKEMERLAQQLPVWESWGADVRAFGARSLAVIIGEAGDLSNYPTPSHLWKRMGLAVLGGTRQGGLSKTAKAEEWIAHGYNPRRRAHVFVIGDCLVKQGDLYRQVYLDRKEYERQRAEASGLIIAPSAKIPKGKEKQYISEGHIHKRSQRYMEKRLLKHLWQAWRRAKTAEEPDVELPDADKLAA